MNIREQIANLSKEELIELINTRCTVISINEHDIRRARANCLIRKAEKMVEDSMEKSSKLHGIQNREAYFREHDKFDQAMKLYEKASKILNV